MPRDGISGTDMDTWINLPYTIKIKMDPNGKTPTEENGTKINKDR